MPCHETVSHREVNSVVCSIQELTTLDNELIYSEQRKDDTWKKIIEQLEGKTQGEAQKLPKKYKLSEFQLNNGLLYCNTEITGKGVSRGKVKVSYTQRIGTKYLIHHSRLRN